jgi:hypothetical protein
MTEPAAALVFAEPSGVVRIWNTDPKIILTELGIGYRLAED